MAAADPVAEADPKRTYKTHLKTKQDQDLIRLALHKSPFFSCLDEEQVLLFVAAAELKTYKKGEIVILEGCVDEDDEDKNDERIPIDVHLENAVPAAVAPDLDMLGPADPDEYLYMDTDEDDEVDASGDHDLSTRKADGGSGPTLSADDDAAKDTEVKVVLTHSSTESSTKSDESEDPDENDEGCEIVVKPLLTAMGVSDPGSSSTEDVAASPHAKSDDDQSSSVYPPPPRSGTPKSIYIVRKGNAGVWYQPRFNAATLGPGSIVGEGGFLFGRQHSASIVASEDNLECWVVDISTFRHHVLVSDNMRQIFQKYATKKDSVGKDYVSMDDFVECVTAQQTHGNSLPSIQESLAGLRIANTYSILQNKKMKTKGEPMIYLDDFCFFHLLMARPDPEVDIAFILMDEKQTGQIFLNDLAKFLRPVFPELDFQSQFFQRYFGKNGNQSIRQTSFSQFLADLQREVGKQAFLRAVESDGTQEGYIPPAKFVRILTTACGWHLPEGVAKRLEDIYCSTGGSSNAGRKNVLSPSDADMLAPTFSKRRDSCLGDRYFSYGDFLAFQEVLGNIPFICNLIDTAQEIKKGPLSRDDFKVANQVLGLGGRLSRRQVDIVFNLFDLSGDGYVSHEDTIKVCGVDYARRLAPVKGRGDRLTFAPPPQYQREEDSMAESMPLAERLTTSALQFGIAAAVGGVSIGLLYPVDLVKTRMMNQRIGLNGTAMYQNSLDCLQQALRVEGFVGLYRGLMPQLIGVAPERIIKLQVHSLLRTAFTSDDGESSDSKPSLWMEALAGGCAGACQLLVTNPMEITKIRLQMQGETSRLLRAKGITPPAPHTFLSVIRSLGFPGVYRGASACLLRDVPFSAIYFPSYAAYKDLLVEANSSNGKARSSDILLAGTVAAIPAALLTTPADLLKTRLQVLSRLEEVSYNGIQDCAVKIYQREGAAAFFQGSALRVLRIAPQFGISVLVYESLADIFGLEKARLSSIASTC